ncbi:MAG TPA: hypothetical protein VF647_07320 [Longimicrobium sp.]|jgi:hypothetical protein
MARRRGGALRLLLVVALLGVGIWFFRDRIPGLGGGGSVAATKVSPEAAAQAQAKLARMRKDQDTVHLTDVEFTSLLRYDLAGLTGPLQQPAVDFVDNTLKLTGSVPKDLLPNSPELAQARRFLPDTVEVMVSGSLRSLRSGHGALNVQDVAIARFPVPASYYPMALERLGRRNEPGTEPNEYPFTLPPGVASARVEGGELILSPTNQ